MAVFDRFTKPHFMLPLALLITSGASVAYAGDGYGRAAPTAAKGDIINGAGEKIGTVTLRQQGGDVVMKIKAKHVSTGLHGAHLHAVGNCTIPDFKDAGGHWNPSAQHHGQPGADTAHRGDLPMISANAAGRVNATIRLQGLHLSGDEQPLLDADGAAVVIHATQDDYRTDPAGNSGARIACAVIR
jgi:Cu-Zn family superoxide dismutase